MDRNRDQKEQGKQKEVRALEVHQWLDEWRNIVWDPKQHRTKPDDHFYFFSLSARDLKSLTGIQIRTVAGGLARSEDLGIQRRHDESRSREIGEYVRYGYPWSTLSLAKRKSGKFYDLRKPGWLPTAIVVNILKPSDRRLDKTVDDNDIINVQSQSDGTVVIKLPKQFRPGWKPKGPLYPIEVIDGQHRLWAFEDQSIDSDFELPVVAFHGLDISWQAYLFWTINIKPKRINASLAYDLYPLLRTEDWLERSDEGYFIYRETRAQELVEVLWSHEGSPWYHHINMLGEPGLKMVSQAAWVRSLMAAYIKSAETRRTPGGLFGALVGPKVLPWSRAQQAAFLIFVGQKVLGAVKSCRRDWAKSLRKEGEHTLDPAFYGPYTLINTDQGIRAILHVTNDLCYVKAEHLGLQRFRSEKGADFEEEVTESLQTFLHDRILNRFIEEIAESLATYDWRTASAPELSDIEKTAKLVFRGSGGYRELRRQLLQHLEKNEGQVGSAAKEVLISLRYI